MRTTLYAALCLALASGSAFATNFSHVWKEGGPTAPLAPTEVIGRVTRAPAPLAGSSGAPVFSLHHASTFVSLDAGIRGQASAHVTYNWATANDFASLGVDRGLAAAPRGNEYLVLVGAPGRVVVNGQTAQTLGAVDVLRVDPVTLNVIAIHSVNGTQVGASFGADVASLGDINGDGDPDFAIAASRYTGTNNQEGRVWVVSASQLLAIGDIGAATVFRSPAADGARFGSQVAGVGDVNGDGYPDLGVMSFLTTANAPAISVYYGGAGGLAASPSWTLTYGAALAGGDFNGDGVSDVAIGIPLAGADQQGRVRVFYGHNPGGPSLAADWIGTPATDSGIKQFYGNALTFLHDTNGDGFDELAVGAPQFSPTPSTTKDGAVYVYRGGAAPSTTALVRLLGPDVSAQWGATLGGVRFHDATGLGQLVVGAPTSADGTGYVAVVEDLDGDVIFKNGLEL